MSFRISISWASSARAASDGKILHLSRRGEKSKTNPFTTCRSASRKTATTLTGPDDWLREEAMNHLPLGMEANKSWHLSQRKPPKDHRVKSMRGTPKTVVLTEGTPPQSTSAMSLDTRRRNFQSSPIRSRDHNACFPSAIFASWIERRGPGSCLPCSHSATIFLVMPSFDANLVWLRPVLRRKAHPSPTLPSTGRE